MIGLFRHEPEIPDLDARRIRLRAPHWSDHRAFAALRAESRSFLEPWEPEWGPDPFGMMAWRDRMRRYAQDAADGSAYTWFLIAEGNRLAGGITLGNIRRGVSQSGQIGYWLGERHAGKGLMSDALAAIVPHAFSKLGLHRLEAACIPGNRRSERVLEKAGFAREGLMRSYLKIGGRWQDHHLYARINEPDHGNGA